MGVISINYDLSREPSSSYRELFEELKSFPAWCRVAESSWLVITDLTPKGVFDVIRPHLDTNDKVFVAPVQIDAGWWAMGLSADVMRWLRNSLSTYTRQS